MSPFTKLPFLSLLCLTTPLVCQGEEHDLKIAAKKGTTVWLMLEEKQEQSIEMLGRQMDTEKTTTHTLQFEIKDVDDKGNLTVEVKIARIHGSMANPMGGDVEFDSAKRTEGEEVADAGGIAGGMGLMTAMAGKSYIAKVDAFGKVAALEGVAELVKAATPDLGGMGAAMGAAAEAQLKHHVERAFGTRPVKPTVLGATWERVDEVNATGVTQQTRLQLTLAKVDAASFEITATGTVGIGPKDAEKAGGAGGGENPLLEMMTKNMKVKNAKISGTQRVSRQDGFVIESSNVTTMDVDMGSPHGGEMSMSVKTAQKTKRTTAEEAMPKPAPKADKDKGEAPKEAGK